jgi:hypothetical protein
MSAIETLQRQVSLAERGVEAYASVLLVLRRYLAAHRKEELSHEETSQEPRTEVICRLLASRVVA